MRKQGSVRLGRDGISVMMNRERALRAREISRPSAENREKAAQTVPQLIERARGRRRG